MSRRTIFLIILLTSFSTPVFAQLNVHDLMCEYTVNPQGIDTQKPRLSWVGQSDKPNSKQTAYQLIVATTPKKLKNNNPDLWDSGKIDSDHCFEIEYKGKPLKSFQQCFWTVRIWD